MRRPFLTCRWSDLCILTYAVPPELLARHVPPGLTLETRDGSAFVSLVAFDFHDTRVWGVAWPGYRHFPELNLRTYVRHGPRRGVVFLREFVGPRLVAWVARTFYGENYAVAPVHSRRRDEPDHLTVERRLTRAGRTHVIAVTGGKPALVPPAASADSFFTELRWGYGTDRRGRATRFEVRHPAWAVYPVRRSEVALDWGRLYGPEWAFLPGQAPCSAVLAAGSPVVVYPRGRVDG
jgi:uncharacterized protein YqjF (DUF2071 family)